MAEIEVFTDSKIKISFQLDILCSYEKRCGIGEGGDNWSSTADGGVQRAVSSGAVDSPIDSPIRRGKKVLVSQGLGLSGLAVIRKNKSACILDLFLLL